jgi:uncharacterized protein YbcI
VGRPDGSYPSLSFLGRGPTSRRGARSELVLFSTRTEHAAGSLAASITTFVVATLREYTGRGPTKARAFINDNLVTVVLQDTMTKGEHSLVRDGKAELVLTMRHAYQETMRPRLVAGIEELTGRRVIAFLSDNHIDPDIAIESFVLAPASDEIGGADMPVVDTSSGNGGMPVRGLVRG